MLKNTNLITLFVCFIGVCILLAIVGTIALSVLDMPSVNEGLKFVMEHGNLN